MKLPSLQIAKFKAELKAQEAQDTILRQKAETQANISTIQAETEKKVRLIKAQASAQATIMQAQAKAAAILNEGEVKASTADIMKSKYGQELALLGEKAKIAEGLKIYALVIGNASGKFVIDIVVPVLKL